MMEKLHHYHLVPLMYMVKMWVIFFALPRLVAESFGTNGWISLFFFSLIAACNLYFISLVYRLGRGKSIFQILEESLPKGILYPFYGFFAMIWGMLACLEGKEFALTIQLMSFPNTSPSIFILILLFLSFLLINKGIYNMVKAITIFFVLSAWMFFLLVIFFLPEFKWVHLTPFIFEGETHMISRGADIYTVFLGYELFLLLFSYVDTKAKFFTAAYVGHFYTTFVYVVSCLICFEFYSLDELHRMVFPILDLLSYIRLPFIERIETLMFNLFLFKAVSAMVFYYWASQEALRHILPRMHSTWLTAFIIGSTSLISYQWDILREVELWRKWFSYTEIGISFVLPLLLLVILLIQRAKRSRVHA